MPPLKKLLWIIIISAMLLGCSDDPEATNTPTNISGAVFPTGSTVVGAGVFTSYAHNLSGIAAIHTDNTGTKYLTLQQFTMNIGPDVHVFLSKSNNYGKANVIELGKLGEEYRRDSLSLDFSNISYNPEYKFVLVYCLEFNSLFGYAELK